jgi:hypothetical protein
MSPSGTTSDTCACMNASTITQGASALRSPARWLPIHHGHGVQFSNGGILFLAAKGAAMKPNLDNRGAGALLEGGRQSACMPAGRELGFRQSIIALLNNQKCDR